MTRPADPALRPDGEDVTPWYAEAPARVAERLDTDLEDGLTPDEVARRIERDGPNALDKEPPRPAWKRLADQFRTTLNLILAIAAGIAFAVGDVKDPIVIAFVLVLNAVLGFVQEGKAASAMAALEEMLTATVKVRRGGRVEEVEVDGLVAGDLVLLDAGDRIPADGRIVAASTASVDESALTGESVPVEKSAGALPLGGEAPSLGDRVNEAFMNTTLVRGRVEMVVTATGMRTEMGRVAELLQGAEQALTPLQRQLDRLGKVLAAIAGVAVSIVFALRMLQGDEFSEAALGAVALAVAAIPEGLPAVVTVTLAVGMHQMAKNNAIVKRLASVETLGSTTTICSDKTGTLTLNQMTVQAVVRGTARYRVTGEGYSFDGEVQGEDGPDGPHDPAHLGDALLAMALANEATVRDGELLGEPTEGAMVVLATKGGLDVEAARRDHPRLGEIPFESATKFMATFHGDGDEVLVCVKGAPDVLVARSGTVAVADDVRNALDQAAADALADANHDLADQGLRVLAVATRRVPAADALVDGRVADPDRWIDELVLEALVGILDPARPEARDAIAECHAAGIDVKMITGDHADTARAIARDLGIEGEVVSGAQLEAMSDDELAERVEDIAVCARVSPEHKVRMVKALQRRNHVVAMTGDGVNDAAALRTAEIGVAMGITGTEVTKEAGDLVLTDDNFATIVGAVERGRTIYDNIVKFVRFQLSTNLGAIGTMLTASILGMPVPLTAIQVLFVNIIADGPPAMSLGVDPPQPGVMDRAPRSPDAQILTLPRLARLAFVATVMTAGTLGVLAWGEDRYGDDSDVALTMAFTTFVLFQMVNVMNMRTDRSVLSRYFFTNWQLWAAVGTVVAIQIAIVQVGLFQGIFDTTALNAGQWLVCAAVALAVLVAEELRKMGQRLLGRGGEGPAESGTARPASNGAADEPTASPAGTVATGGAFDA
jgi:Ca2+-transporting ATPase